MTKRFLFAVVGVALCVVAASSFNLHAREEASDGRNDLKAEELANAAREAYEASRSQFNTGWGGIEEIYQWSKRLSSAQLRSGVARAEANSGHEARMQELLEIVRKLNEHGAEGGSAANLAFAKYYWLEAKNIE